MKRITYFLLVLILFSGCSDQIEIKSVCDIEPEIFPDYKDVTIPYNVAPLCFSVIGEETTALIVKGEKDSLVMRADDGNFNIPMKKWQKMMGEECGKQLTFTICRKTDMGWQAMRPFRVNVSEDAIDPYLVYRKINPGYGLWNRMGIYQRSLEDYEETPIYENREGRGNCINCHSFCEGNPEKWQVHIRMRFGGTYIFDGEEQTTLKLKDKSHGNPVYPNWHPNGELIAYSNNSTFFLIHTLNKNRWEVMDEESDVFVADINTGEQFRSEQTSSPSSFETFPCFSPDGSWLYFCSAKAREDVVGNYDSVQYSIVRVSFDAEKRTFGNDVDTIYNALLDGGSASFPRISPDGRWLCFTRSAYGNFSICHRDAELCLIDLRSEPFVSYDITDLSGSFHSWSRNSRWLVFSSKHDGDIYTKPYFVHIDGEGNTSKPFLLPQRDAMNHYDLEMVGYNIPELVSGKILTKKIELIKSSQQQQTTSVSVN